MNKENIKNFATLAIIVCMLVLMMFASLCLNGCNSKPQPQKAMITYSIEIEKIGGYRDTLDLQVHGGDSFTFSIDSSNHLGRLVATNADSSTKTTVAIGVKNFRILHKG